MAISVGIDLVEIAEVGDAIARHGSRYLERVYTEAELHECAGRPSCLAGRFAAKEAMMKALRAERALSWRSISVELDARSRPAVLLSGDALELAQLRSIGRCSVDLRVDRRRALALVLAHADPGAL